MSHFNFWRLQGWLYDALFVLVPHRRLVEEVARTTGKHNDLILDAGCGSGRLSQWSASRVVGIDFSESMIRAARRRKRGSVFKADLNAPLPFSSHTFDYVVSLNVLYALPRPGVTLMELARVLNYGGELVVATPTTSKLTPLVVEHFKTASPWQLVISFINLPRLIAWCINLGIRGWFDNSRFTWLSEAELTEAVKAAGLKVISVEPCYAGIDIMLVARKEG